MYMGIFAYIYICILYVCLMPLEAKNGQAFCESPGLWTRPRSSGRATSAPNCLPSLQPCESDYLPCNEHKTIKSMQTKLLPTAHMHWCQDSWSASATVAAAEAAAGPAYTTSLRIWVHFRNILLFKPFQFTYSVPSVDLPKWNACPALGTADTAELPSWFQLLSFAEVDGQVIAKATSRLTKFETA